jgi:AAA+ superfamily predicted ATPase
MGPPGNGKTFCLMGLIKLLKLPCLYVRSFKTDYGSEEHNIREVFRRARESVPCLLVLEDLDALVNDGNRAFFLNELDGFALNEGLITIATTNHPEQLDPAILERPSRFDRRYTFALPADGERRQYLELWNQKLQSDMQIEPKTIQTFVEQTSGFSYATLKELILSSMMAWIEQCSRPIAEIIGQQIDLLR